MKEDLKAIKALFAVFVFVALGIAAAVHADTGPEGATRVESGNFFNVKQVTLSTTPSLGGTQLISVTTARPCVKIHNNSATLQVYISSYSAIASTSGYQVEVSSAPGGTLELGNFTGVLFGIGPAGATVPSVSVGECNSNVHGG